MRGVIIPGTRIYYIHYTWNISLNFDFIINVSTVVLTGHHQVFVDLDNLQ